MGLVTCVRRGAVVGAGVASFAAACSISAAAVSLPVGYVYDMTGQSSAFSLIRNGKQQGIGDYSFLFNGDRVIAAERKDPSGKAPVATLLIGSRYYRVSYANSPFCVGAAGSGCKSRADTQNVNPVPKVLLSIVGSMLTIFKQAQEDAYSSQADEMVARGEPPGPAIPMMPASPLVFQTADSPVLAFAWLGGQAPFTVSVFAHSSPRAIATLTGVTQNDVTIEGLHLSPGKYRVRVEDALQRVAIAHFECVTQDSPALPIDAIGVKMQLPQDAIATIRAGSLVRFGREWYLSAYEALAALPADAAGEVHDLRYWLSEGLPPPQ